MDTYKWHCRVRRTSNSRHFCILIFHRESIYLKISIVMQISIQYCNINNYDNNDYYTAVFWIMNLLSLQWIPSNISEHLHPKVPFPYSTHVPPFLQYASPLGLHLSNHYDSHNKHWVIIIKTIFLNVSKVTYLFHIGYPRRV